MKTMIILQSTENDQRILDAVNGKTADTASVTADFSMHNLLQLIGLILLLVFILVLAYYTTRFIGKVKIGQLKNSNFEVIDTYRISTSKMLQIVKIANKYIVIAVGKDSIQYITELDETEVLMKEVNAEEKQSFKQIIEKLKYNSEKLINKK